MLLESGTTSLKAVKNHSTGKKDHSGAKSPRLTITAQYVSAINTILRMLMEHPITRRGDPRNTQNRIVQ
jgi:hypothetical protein